MVGIKVIYVDGGSGVAGNASALETMIKEKKIVAYCRPNEEWIKVKADPARVYKILLTD